MRKRSTLLLLAVLALIQAGCKHQAPKSTADSGNSRFPFHGDDQAASISGVGVYANDEAIDVADAEDATAVNIPVRMPTNSTQRWDPPPLKVRPLTKSARARQLQHTPMINNLSRQLGMEPAFVHAIVTIESAYKPCVNSPAGAVGLMQLMPGTANALHKKTGITAASRCVPHLNVRAGITYFKQMTWANGNLQAMAAGYNSGPARAKALLQGNTRSKYWRAPQRSTSNGVPGPHYWGGETYNYARKMAGYYELYKANPQLIGLGVDESPTAGSGCDAREQC